MNSGIIVVGFIVLLSSVFGLSYSNQQGPLDQAEDGLSGQGTNWDLINSVSVAGIVGGVILIALGIIPESYYSDSSSR